MALNAVFSRFPLSAIAGCLLRRSSSYSSSKALNLLNKMKVAKKKHLLVYSFNCPTLKDMWKLNSGCSDWLAINLYWLIFILNSGRSDYMPQMIQNTWQSFAMHYKAIAEQRQRLRQLTLRDSYFPNSVSLNSTSYYFFSILFLQFTDNFLPLFWSYLFELSNKNKKTSFKSFFIMPLITNSYWW